MNCPHCGRPIPPEERPELLTVGETIRWLRKLELLTSDGAKLIHIRNLLERAPPELVASEAGRSLRAVKRKRGSNKGGRPRTNAVRCPCGRNTLKRAKQRGFECCKKAGIMKRGEKWQRDI